MTPQEEFQKFQLFVNSTHRKFQEWLECQKQK